MKKSVTIIIILLVIACIGVAQDDYLARIRHNLSVASDDTSRMRAMINLSNYYQLGKSDSALIYGYKALALARKIKFPKGEFDAMECLIVTQGGLGNDSKTLQLIFQASKIAEKNNMSYEKVTLIFNRGAVYARSKDYTKALNLYGEAKKSCDSLNDSILSPLAQLFIGKMYLAMHQLDSALYHCEAAYKNAVKVKNSWVPQYILLQLGNVQNELGNTDLALSYFRQMLLKADASENKEICACYLSIAQLYQKIGKPDSAVFYAGKSLELARESGFYNDIIDANLFLSDIYEKKDLQQALLYSKEAINYKDSLRYIVESTTQETFIDLDEQERQREIEDAKAEFKNRLKINAFIGISFTLLIIAIVLYRSSKLKQRAKQNIGKAYAELKSTQAQLIQSEKMASLGELTAGIAHEIQNPLNFVNNFSEVNREMLEELKAERLKPNADKTLEDDLIDDVIANEEKINHHGKRADAIVKGMLQHSKQTKGIKEPTDINALCDEYIRLSYHGLRAKDKNFNAEIKTDFDESIGKINVVPQDIGRVLLNLFNNAFYAVNEKKKLLANSYQPLAEVRTRRINDKIEIKISDNGNGIPSSIIDKIFQPFFTTKPTGQGTGLGLSLAYDIITKEHNGKIKVESKEGEESAFIIQLPIS